MMMKIFYQMLLKILQPVEGTEKGEGMGREGQIDLVDLVNKY